MVNLTWITADVAIGGRISESEAGRLGADERVGAVVDLRSEAVDEAAVLRRQGIAFLHLPTDDHAAITPAMLELGVAFVQEHLALGRRTLIHCEHGIGRSATLALAVLVAEGRTPLGALNLAKGKRGSVSPSPAQYGCWRDWLEDRKAAGGETWEVPDFDAFAAIAYRHLTQAR
jgi:hypothetical protein